MSAARPKFGGTLRVEIDATIRSLLPTATATDEAEASARDRVIPLVFETLVSVGADGLRPMLATSWDSDPAGSRWRFRLRQRVVLHNGSMLEPWQVATALRASAPGWKISNDADTIVIEPDRPIVDLPWMLAGSQFGIAIRTSGSDSVGTGPFRLDRQEPSLLMLRAHDDYWDRRPFVDGVRIDMGRPIATQLADVENGRADLVSIRPTEIRRISERGLRVIATRPIELVALLFEQHRAGADDLTWRKTLATSFNRAAMGTVLFQQRADPAEALLPAWLSGYRLTVASPAPRLSRPQVASLPIDRREPIVRVNPSDPLARAVVERIAVDAREAGFSIRVQTPTGLAPRPDARLVRLRLVASTPEHVLADVAVRIGSRPSNPAAASSPAPGAALDAVYLAEQALLESFVIVPIVHVPDLYVAGRSLEWWNEPPIDAVAAWNLGDAWVKAPRP